MTLNQIIEIFKDISVAHPEINSFHTGLNFEHNDSNINYPALRMVFPYTVAYKQENAIAEYTFNLTAFVNEVEEKIMESSLYVNTNYHTQDAQLDEGVGELKDENKLRDRALGIMNNVLETLIEQEKCNDYFEVTNYKIKALERANDDFVTGVSLSVTIRTENTYRCEYPDLLTCDSTQGQVFDTSGCPELPEPKRYSMDYNGVDRYDSISQTSNNVFDLDWQQPLTFETWYFHVPGQTMYFYSKVNSSAGYFFSTIGSRDVVRFQMRNTRPFNLIDVYSKGTLSAGWNHIVITYNGNGGAEYDVQFTINNVPSVLPNDWSQGSQLTGGTTSNTALAETGRLGAFNAYGTGTVTHMRLWKNVELTSTEITTLYNGGKVLYDNVPQDSFLLFDTGFADENHSWYGVNGWIMEELSGNSNFIFGRNSTISDRNINVPS